MTKYEAFYSNRFERVELTSLATTRTGRVWAQGTITYRRHDYERPITEDFQLELDMTKGKTT